ncbi:MAG: S46 family peptidase [Polyangiaceae bacterium]|nr:S46 family peptidase [Polyangiaceae bacterium]
MRSPVSFCALLALVAGCASTPPEPARPPLAAPVASTSASAAASPVPPPPAPVFENPGGMWMPEQLKAQTETLRRLGVDDPSKLTDPMSSVLGAIVFLGGCSASFVSPEGLVVTNHHCVQGALQYNSTPEQNLIEHGYLAKTRADERSAGPAARVFVTQAITEVTAKVLAGVDAEKDDRSRYKKMEQRQKDLVAACEAGRPEVRCTVARYFEGASYFQIEQLELRDVRLVYAPAAGIGNYGGEIDNWRWPRHTGDFSFYRAYVGPDGKPADYSKDNVPYKPRHALKLATTPLGAGDFVVVAGYPGRTSRWKTAREVREAVEWAYPRRIRTFDHWLKLIASLSSDKELALKAEPLNRGLANYLTNSRGQLDGLVKGGLLEQRERQERELLAWIDADPGRKAAYGPALARQRELLLGAEKTREKDATLGELSRFSHLFGAAMTIVRMAEERPKPDAEREPDFQQRNWRRTRQWLVTMSRQLHRTLDRELFASVLGEALTVPEAERSELVAWVGGAHATPESIAKASMKLFDKPSLADEKARVEAFDKATTASLRASRDPLIQLALRARALVREQEARKESLEGALALVRPAYVEAMKKASPVPLSPDANATLRLTYGTVRGYRPTPDAPVFRPFSTLSEVVAKHTGKDPFVAPQALLDAAAKKRLGPYVDGRLGDVPVDFLADLHITGGNSGSATLNARGELVGLVFDGNYEAMASDWVFVPSLTRSIHVDVRYMLWVMDAVDGADHLLTELGVTPSL